MIARANERANTCQVSFDIPWELAQALVPLVSQLLTALLSSVQARAGYELDQQAAREQTTVAAEKNKAQWSQLAAECEAEIKRRANDPGSRQVIIRQLAAELKVPVNFLQTILRVSRREQRADKRKAQSEQYRQRKAQILRLKFAGKSSSEIAAAVGISTRQVNNYLADAAGKPRARSDRRNATTAEEPTS